jgi:hypothetical protein
MPFSIAIFHLKDRGAKDAMLGHMLNRERRVETDAHRVLSRSIGEMLCPYSSYFIVPEVKCGECLCGRSRSWIGTIIHKWNPEYQRITSK